MPILVQSITEAEADKLTWVDEGQFADVKAIETKPSKLTEDISAFANADGGDLYIGIDETKLPDGKKLRFWRGFHDQEAANAHLEVFARYFPIGSELHCEFFKCDARQGLVLHVVVNKTVGVALASNNVPYLRVNAASIPQNTPELRRRLEYSKGVVSFENELTNADKEVVTASDIVKEFIREVVPSSAPEEHLRKQLLIKQDKATVAAVLLFADEPQAVLPKHCGITHMRSTAAPVIDTKPCARTDSESSTALQNSKLWVSS